MTLRTVGCEDQRWTELARNHVKWQALVLEMLNVQILLPKGYHIGSVEMNEVQTHHYCSMFI